MLGLLRGADKESHRMMVYHWDVWYTTNNMTLNTSKPEGAVVNLKAHYESCGQPSYINHEIP